MNHEEDHLEDAALTKAAWSGHIDVIRILFDAVADMNSKDCCCKTALIRAAEPGHADVVRALVDAGAELNLKTSRDETALIKVAKSRHIDVVLVLVDVGADDRRAYYAGRLWEEGGGVDRRGRRRRRWRRRRLRNSTEYLLYAIQRRTTSGQDRRDALHATAATRSEALLRASVQSLFDDCDCKRPR